MKQVISLVKKNYRLENLDEGLEAQDKTGEVGTILRLNQAGRRYLITDAGSIAKGVEVLVAVRDDLGCLFYHLLQNPLLCDLEKMAAFRSSASSPRTLQYARQIILQYTSLLLLFFEAMTMTPLDSL
jgi:hypothetical protein